MDKLKFADEIVNEFIDEFVDEFVDEFLDDLFDEVDDKIVHGFLNEVVVVNAAFLIFETSKLWALIMYICR